jgi:hypothetical protein
MWYEGQKSGYSGLDRAGPDEVGQVRSVGAGHAEALAAIGPERHGELGAGLQQAEEDVAAAAGAPDRAINVR